MKKNKKTTKVVAVPEETKNQINEALKKTDCFIDISSRKRAKSRFKDKNGRSPTWADFDPVVVAGLFYALETEQINFKQLARRALLKVDETRENQEQQLMLHPVWAGLVTDSSDSKNRIIEIGTGVKIIVPTGLYTDNLAIEQRIRQIIMSGLYSEDLSIVLSCSNLYIKARQAGLLEESHADQIISEVRRGEEE